LGIDRRHAQSAAHADNLLGVADPARHAHGPDHAVEQASSPADLLHFPGGLADRLHHQCDRAGGRVEIRDGQRDALAVLVGQDDDELARSGRLRHGAMSSRATISSPEAPVSARTSWLPSDKSLLP
jgi:hypothetical protein